MNLKLDFRIAVDMVKLCFTGIDNKENQRIINNLPVDIKLITSVSLTVALVGERCALTVEFPEWKALTKTCNSFRCFKNNP